MQRSCLIYNTQRKVHRKHNTRARAYMSKQVDAMCYVNRSSVQIKIIYALSWINSECGVRCIAIICNHTAHQFFFFFFPSSSIQHFIDAPIYNNDALFSIIISLKKTIYIGLVLIFMNASTHDFIFHPPIYREYAPQLAYLRTNRISILYLESLSRSLAVSFTDSRVE